MRLKPLILPILSLAVLTLLGGLFLLKKAGTSSFCANSETCIKNQSGKYVQATTGVFEGKNVFAPKEIAENYELKSVLGKDTGIKKRIYVDLAKQRLYAYEGTKRIYNFPISSGKWGWTPTGEFRIWIKLRYTRMAGGSAALGTYYNLPNVPFTMYFYNNQYPKTQGFGLHGTYWHNNFGHPMSHGCINMKTEDAEKIYYWSMPSPTSTTTYADAKNPGTSIIIYGTAPRE